MGGDTNSMMLAAIKAASSRPLLRADSRRRTLPQLEA